MRLSRTYWWSAIDTTLVFPAMTIVILGLVSMASADAHSVFFEKQIIWFSVSLAVFLVAQSFEYRFLRNTSVVLTIFLVTIGLLFATFVLGSVFKGARSWIDLGLFAVQPAELAKLTLIIILSKYFSRRHVEIAQIRHVVVSGLYAFVLFALVALQPDFGSAMILAGVWFFMVLSSGIPWRNLFGLITMGVVAVACMWFFVFAQYQKDRIMTFLHPLRDTRGAGYNAQQSVIAVGSGELFGKGLGHGTQSELKFLPEYETDFIFATYAEEWGFVGVLMLLALFSFIIFRLLTIASRGETNFESLFAIGVASLFVAETIINIGMNVAVMPVTGVALPFMSYGGSHLLVEWTLLGMIVGMKRHSRAGSREEMQREQFSA
ncbi:MAG: rod shape-determining protein RodA [Minisyncoccia bacterium]